MLLSETSMRRDFTTTSSTVGLVADPRRHSCLSADRWFRVHCPG
jgi:hypothetical protein